MAELRRNVATMFRKYQDVQVSAGRHGRAAAALRRSIELVVAARESPCLLAVRWLPRQSASVRLLPWLPPAPQTPEVVDLLIYKGREELEVRAGQPLCRGLWPPAAGSHRPCGPLPSLHPSVMPAAARLVPRARCLPGSTSRWSAARSRAAAPAEPAQPRRPAGPAPPPPQMILMQHKQRHHLITQYVHNPALDRVQKSSGLSPFLEQFYKSN